MKEWGNVKERKITGKTEMKKNNDVTKIKKSGSEIIIEKGMMT